MIKPSWEGILKTTRKSQRKRWSHGRVPHFSLGKVCRGILAAISSEEFPLNSLISSISLWSGGNCTIQDQTVSRDQTTWVTVASNALRRRSCLRPRQGWCRVAEMFSAVLTSTFSSLSLSPSGASWQKFFPRTWQEHSLLLTLLGPTYLSIF